MASKAVEHLLANVPITEGTTLLEVGSGTGLCSEMLAAKGIKVVGVDTSIGMVNAFNAKAEKLGLVDKMKSVQILLTSDKTPQQQLGDLLPAAGFDVAFSHLTFHHVPSIKETLLAVMSCLKEHSGVVAISDFEAELHAPEFHPSNIHGEVQRHGLVVDDLARDMEAVGLQQVKVLRPFKIDKDVESGGSRKFQFILSLGTRP
ncbi:hypothetical protein CLOM_g256 [Closterium sp. NIES-68]|nr:hypothetical protein CLOM_g256 [Closterium sp. NIES-68]GJP64874.1 hypothetical protein CLOP_g21814 [Closterium sp. NIES-67]GJP77723.1 hypothetical protein CLOP_g8081 [Closterium sp. NIES-67]